MKNKIKTAMFVVVLVLSVFPMMAVPVNADISSSQWVDRGNGFLQVGRWQDGLNAYDKAVELDPNNADAWTGKGCALMDLGRCQESVDALDRALELDPNNLHAWCHKGWALGCLGKHEEAVAVAEEVIDICDQLIADNPNDNDAWHYKGSELNFLGKNEDALIALNKALELGPNNPHTWFVKGEALFALGRYQEAVDAFDKATKLNPHLAHFWYGKGNALFALGRYQEANEAYDRAYGDATTPSTTTPIPITSSSKTPQLTISQTTLKEEPEVGEEAIITVSIANTGSGTAKSIQLTENIPSSVSVSYVNGADSTGNLVTWIGELRPGETHIIQHTFRIIEEKDRFFPVIVRYEDADGNRHETSTTIYISANMPESTTTMFPEIPLTWIIAISVVLMGIAIIVAVRRRGGEGGAEITIEENN